MIEVEGLKELEAYIEGLVERLTSSRAWGDALGRLLEIGRRHAAKVSPVVSGSYQRAHRVVVGDFQAELSIDPSARNRGVPVGRYAAPVESRHHVYESTYEDLQEHLDNVAEELINGKRQ